MRSGLDEDNDGATDCADTDCEETAACGGPIDCCTPKKSTGCSADATIESCVCAIDDACCGFGWDLFCAHTAKLTCAATCELPDENCETAVDEDGNGAAGCDEPACTDSPSCVAADACCETSASAGCASAGIEGCVCGTDSFCCDTAWDAGCVVLATNCGAKCGPTGVCCDFEITAGCAGNTLLETCVCDRASECCTNAWDDLCISIAAAQCGATCP
ncbi:MAG: hypothetical protein ACI9OJ_003624 [Myxococcota bacterium]|jgi:hypothetical protein